VPPIHHHTILSIRFEVVGQISFHVPLNNATLTLM
jgi:hypothetical protein